MAAVMEEKSALGLREVVLLVFSALILFIFISLVTFNNEDAGFSHSGSLQSIHNSCGMVGAWIADFTLSLFGLMAFCVPMMLAWIGYLVYRDQLHTENNLIIIIRYIGFVITLAFGSALFYLHLSRTALALPSGTGGILGQELGDLAFLVTGNSGATLLLLVGFLGGITLLTDLSWFKLMDTIGRYTLLGVEASMRLLNNDSPAAPKAATTIKSTKAAPEAAAKPSLFKKAVESFEKILFHRSKPTLAMNHDLPFDEQVLNKDFKFDVQMNRLSSENLNRHEPQLNMRTPEDALRAEKRLAALRAAKLEASPGKTTTTRAVEPSFGPPDLQFEQPTSRFSAEPVLRTREMPPVAPRTAPVMGKPTATEQRTAPTITTPMPDKALSAKVMGFDAHIGTEKEITLQNFPPLLNDVDFEDMSYPDLSVVEKKTLAEPLTAQAPRTREPLNTPSRPVTPTSHAVPRRAKTGEVLPNLSLLDERDTRVNGYSAVDLEEMSRLVEAVLQDFNVVVEVVAVHPGPVITRFELQPAAGVKVSRISGLSKDMARALSVTSVRIVENIPGKSVIGLEIPNQEREMVTLRELLVSPIFKEAKSVLTLAMGKDIAGLPVVADLGKMPHALVAGTTGSGKSVAINTMILSLLYKATPEQVRMIMIDPKMLELSVYEGIPHLLTPVVTDMKEASNALRWAVAEMERRYKLMSKMGVRNLAGFNQLVADAAAQGQTIRDPMFQYDKPLGDDVDFPTLTTLPSIVIVIDELADMMMIVGKKVEELIARLAQKARAAGIHLILATQRPSVDVLTGLIKANVPTRISFQVSSRIDSRTILDQGGAETLLGNGDMLFLPSGTSIPIRAHGAFVDDHEVHRVVEFLKQTAPPNYLEEITREMSDSSDLYGGSNGSSEADSLYDQAVMFVTETRKASISSVQRKFKIGYNKAANIIEEMEAAGVVSAPESNGSREVLAPAVHRSDD